MGKGVPHRKMSPKEAWVGEIPPEQLDWIGRVAAAWSYLEVSPDDLIWHLLDLDDEDGKIMTSRNDSNRKVQLIRSLAANHLSPTKFGELKRLPDTITALQEDRNFIVHGIGEW